MYIEKDFLIKKLDEWCELKGYELSYSEKDFLSSQVSRALDQDRLLTFEQFNELLDHNEQLEQYQNVDFDDEIISIEEVGEEDTIDFNVTGDRLFYANGILTHNSATNDIDEADNSNISDSMGTAMTADFMLFLLQNEELKAKREIVCKCTKNRFTGRTDTWMMGIDYDHMRFYDMVIQNAGHDIQEVTFGSSEGSPVDADFGIVTAKKLEEAKIYADNEVKNIVREDSANVRKADADKKDPFDDDLDSIYKELGI